MGVTSIVAIGFVLSVVNMLFACLSMSTVWYKVGETTYYMTHYSVKICDRGGCYEQENKYDGGTPDGSRDLLIVAMIMLGIHLLIYLWLLKTTCQDPTRKIRSLVTGCIVYAVLAFIFFTIAWVNFFRITNPDECAACTSFSGATWGPSTGFGFAVSCTVLCCVSSLILLYVRSILKPNNVYMPV